jgi:hypothetical protein
MADELRRQLRERGMKPRGDLVPKIGREKNGQISRMTSSKKSMTTTTTRALVRNQGEMQCRREKLLHCFRCLSSCQPRNGTWSTVELTYRKVDKLKNGDQTSSNFHLVVKIKGQKATFFQSWLVGSVPVSIVVWALVASF